MGLSDELLGKILNLSDEAKELLKEKMLNGEEVNITIEKVKGEKSSIEISFTPEDGSEYGLDPDDFDSEEEYIEALEEAIEEALEDYEDEENDECESDDICSITFEFE